MITLIYLLVSFIATMLGASAGLGGGVIIKPVLDVLGQYDIATIGVLSSATVFSMTVVSTLKHIRAGTKLQGRLTVMLALGSILGGVAGAEALDAFLAAELPLPPKSIQSLMLAALLLLILIYMWKKDSITGLHIRSGPAAVGIGLMLGIVSSFLGIGGGPINVAVLSLFFAMTARSAAVHSVLIILFSQAAKLVTVMLGTGLLSYDLSMLLVMIPGGIMGGIVGTRLNRTLSERRITLIFNLVLAGLVLLNLFNAARALGLV